MIRIGQSSDIHPLVKNRPLIIGGVKIEYHLGLKGHSDADALCHAIAEALIGALGLGDIGKHFPDTDKQYQGISSLVLLSKVAVLLASEGYQIINIDSLIIIEKPKLAGYILQMRTNIAQALGIDLALINVKATRAEGLSFIGREEGVMAQAVVLIETKQR
ncbi:MAG: 2-C-methyl-D-erythritol 2,4-cyclodiphosphate synthase [Erysipelotrichaceae bacterium]|nr:2-C-methyl-D-erythritol 2,4-cyclodiphosphate synthase [Erysipelotrichaceae bacterium]